MMLDLLTRISAFAVPVAVSSILLYGAVKGVKVHEVFVEGARDGIDTAMRILPYLVAMFVAVGVFRQSGAMDMVLKGVEPLMAWFGIPSKVVPMALLRPLSGSGALGYVADTLKTEGPDSMVGRMVSTIQGSCDTTFYIVAVYFGAVRIKKVRHSVFVGLMADAAGFIAAVLACRIVFRN